MLQTSELPEELVIHILKYLSTHDLCQIQLVSRNWVFTQVSQCTQAQLNLCSLRDR